jgi:hypothetical protein
LLFLISYRRRKAVARVKTRRSARGTRSTTFSTPTRNYVGSSLLQLIFRCTAHLVVTIICLHEILIERGTIMNSRYRSVPVSLGSVWLGSRTGWSRSILHLVCEHVNGAISTSEYSLNMRDELVPQKPLNEFAPVQLCYLLARFLPAPSFSSRSSAPPELGRCVAAGGAWAEASHRQSSGGAWRRAELGRRRRIAAVGGPRAARAEPWPRSSSCYSGREEGRGLDDGR